LSTLINLADYRFKKALIFDTRILQITSWINIGISSISIEQSKICIGANVWLLTNHPGSRTDQAMPTKHDNNNVRYDKLNQK
jgi:hypothetical protein